MLLIKAERLFCPEEADGPADILIGGGTILGLLSPSQSAAAEPLCDTVIDASGLVACPGFVDLHQHITGGGGEAGPSSRTPEAALSELLRAGVTTVAGLLGTDAICRSQENLIAKAAALAEDGITAVHWAGGYVFPPATATGSVQRDLALLPGCVGVGEVALSDHRGSQVSADQLAGLAREVRVGGMLSGRPGLVVHCHMGGGPGMLRPLRDAVAAGAGVVAPAAFLPTHVGRSRALAEGGAAWMEEGGLVDLTASSEQTPWALELYRSRGLLGRCTVSSDAYGSLPVFDEHQRLVGYGVADPGALLRLLRHMCADPAGPCWPLAEALPLLTSAPAARLGLADRKGRLAVGAAADVLLLDPRGSASVPGTTETSGTATPLGLRYVVARGELVLTPDWVRGGVFERGPGIRPRMPRLQAAQPGFCR